LEQPDEHSADLDDVGNASITFESLNEIRVTTELQVIFELGAGSDGDLQELGEVAIRFATAALGDVGRDGERRAAQLTDQPGIVRSRDRGSEPLHIEGERMRQPPNSKVSIRLHK
jgi:hypothetical protein